MYVCMCAFMCTSVHKCVCVTTSVTLRNVIHLFWVKSLTGLDQLGKADWPVSINVLLSLLPWCWNYKYASSHLDFHMGSTDKTKASALPTGSSSQPSRYPCSHGLDSNWVIYAWLQGNQQLIRTCFQHDNSRSTRGPCLNTKSHFKAPFPSHGPKQGTEPSPKLKMRDLHSKWRNGKVFVLISFVELWWNAQDWAWYKGKRSVEVTVQEVTRHGFWGGPWDRGYHGTEAHEREVTR